MNKKTLFLPAATLLSAAFALTATAQEPIVSQFFNNNPGGSDLPASDYNWSIVTANGTAFATPAVSQGNTNNPDVSRSTGERPLGSGFIFSVPSTSSDVPGASLFYTTHTGISSVYQPNPQPDWYSTWATSINGLTMGEVSGINFRANAGSNNGFTGHVALQIQGKGWVVSNVGHTLTTTWQQFDQPIDLNTDQWFTGVFDGTTLDGNPTDNALTFLTVDDVVTGIGYYGITGAVAGNSSRLRLDRLEVIPEPSTYAALFGLIALGAILVRRRRR
jgi:hypothetical protein